MPGFLCSRKTARSEFGMDYSERLGEILDGGGGLLRKRVCNNNLSRFQIGNPFANCERQSQLQSKMMKSPGWLAIEHEHKVRDNFIAFFLLKIGYLYAISKYRTYLIRCPTCAARRSIWTIYGYRTKRSRSL